jgi:hypothetical protein
MNDNLDTLSNQYKSQKFYTNIFNLLELYAKKDN